MSGWFGMGNLGDELILQSIVLQLRSKIRNLTVTVLSERPYQLQDDYGLPSLRSTGRRLDTVRRIIAISRADLFILGGGGILMDYGRGDTNISKWLKDMEIAQKLRVHNMTWGIGVGRIWTDTSETWVKRVLAKADSVSVRDSGSALALSRLGIKENVTVTCDSALMLPDLNEFEGKRAERLGRKDKPSILVCLRRWYVDGNWTHDEKVFNDVKSSLAELLSYLFRTKGALVTFVPLRTEEMKKDDDREVENEVRSKIDASCPTTLIDRVPSSREFMRLVSESDLMIGMRLHSLIVASAIGVPCIGLSYDDKVSNYMMSVGAGDWTLSMEGVNFESLRRLAEDALNGAYPVDSVKRQISARKESALAEVDGAIALIGGAKSPRPRTWQFLDALGLSIKAILAPRQRTGTAQDSRQKGG